jgi:hypothetical protein
MDMRTGYLACITYEPNNLTRPHMLSLAYQEGRQMSIQRVHPLPLVSKIVLDDNDIPIGCNALILIEMALVSGNHGTAACCIDLYAYGVCNINAMMNTQIIAGTIRAIRIVAQPKISIVGSNRPYKPVMIKGAVSQRHF